MFRESPILLTNPPHFLPRNPHSALFLSSPQPAAAAAVLGATGAAAAALGAPAVSVAQQAPAVVSPVSAEAPGTGAGGGGGANLEASLLANLKKKIKEKAAAPEKLKTTGVAFQAVEEVCMCTQGRSLATPTAVQKSVKLAETVDVIIFNVPRGTFGVAAATTCESLVQVPVCRCTS